MKHLAHVLIGLLILCSFQGQAQKEPHSRVLIHLDESNGLGRLFQEGILLDHFSKTEANTIEAVLNKAQIAKLNALSYTHRILIEDVTEHYQKQNKIDQASRGVSICDLQHFEFGSMGHYHSNDEVIKNLDSMRILFPNLISMKDSIGHTVEGRAIYAVKISDNPDIDESSQEAVAYFDALHHSREPMSMEPLLYYMWWLLENYDSDEEAKFIVDRRELHFVLVVNVDGYIYNQQTNPNGGGLWRKNRRDNGGGVYGVDLNRNYSSEFGNPIGSSSDSSLGTYGGPSAFSEPETQAVRDYVLGIEPSIMFATHSHGQKILISPGCLLPLDNFETYAEFASEFIHNEYHGYGTTSQMLNYTSCGTERHFFHDNGIISWTPELGTAFWPPQSEFCSTIYAFQSILKYVSHVSGSYARVVNVEYDREKPFFAGDTIEVNFRIKNRGLSFDSKDVGIRLKSLNSLCTVLDTLVWFDSIQSRSFVQGSARVLVSSSAGRDSLELELEIEEDGFVSSSRELKLFIGDRNLLFKDNSEGGAQHWNSNKWDTTFMDMHSGSHSFADSRYDNYDRNDYQTITLDSSINMAGSMDPRLIFTAKWSLEVYDYVELQIRESGQSWSTLRYFSEHQHWQDQIISLQDYVNAEEVEFRFVLESDGGVQSDGFYFDDFNVLDYFGAFSGERELELDEMFEVFPNPAEETLVIKNKLSEPYDLYLMDVKGSLVHTGLSEEPSLELNISSLPAGVYQLHIQQGQNRTTKKVVKL